MIRCVRALIIAGGVLLGPTVVARAATITVNDIDAPGEGFNDSTPVDPVGGNGGTTIGQQRLNVFNEAARLWGDTLESVPTIVIDASFAPLACDANQITLGQAAPTTFKGNFAGGPHDVYVPIALANALAGKDLNGNEAEIEAMFNGGLSDCTHNQSWYYGLDGDAGDDLDLLSVVLHEFGHGLGFTSTIDPSDGMAQNGLLDLFVQHVYDNGTNQAWSAMTDSERATSARNARHLVWDGPNVARQAPSILATGSPIMSAPAVAGLFDRVSEAEFGPYLSARSASGTLKIPAVSPIDCTVSTNVTGSVVLFTSGTCPGAAMAHYAELRGAVGALVMDQVGSDPPYSVATPPSYDDLFPVAIPVVGVSQHDAMLLAAAPGTAVMLSATADQQVGMDTSGRTDLFASSPVQGLSTLAHWDPLARPDLLMEPMIASHAPHDMRMELAAFRDMGWHTVCGNGEMDPGEQCDLGDQNGAPGGSCRADCTAADGGGPGSGGQSGSGGSSSGIGGMPGGSGVATTTSGGDSSGGDGTVAGADGSSSSGGGTGEAGSSGGCQCDMSSAGRAPTTPFSVLLLGGGATLLAARRRRHRTR